MDSYEARPIESVQKSMQQSGKKITRHTCCPLFFQRRSFFAEEKTGGVCKYAWFELGKSETPETGICKYPIRQTN